MWHLSSFSSTLFESSALMADGRKELIPKGLTGGLVIMEDHPNSWE